MKARETRTCKCGHTDSISPPDGMMLCENCGEWVPPLNNSAAAESAFLAKAARRVGPTVNIYHERLPGSRSNDAQWRVVRCLLEYLGFTYDQIHALATTGELPKGEQDE